MEKVKQPLFKGAVKNTPETPVIEKEANVIQEEAPKTITLTTEELDALLDAKLAKLQQPSQAKTVESPIVKIIQNELNDEIPELRNFERKERIYVLIDGTKPESREIPTRHKDQSPLQYINNETNETFSLYFSMTQSSFFKEKQKGDVKVDYLFMKDGMLKTTADDIKIQKFLAINPHNVAMGGSLFEEYNPGKEAEKANDLEDQLFEAQKLVREISFLKQDAVARLMCSDYKEDWVSAELKRSLYSEVKKDPERFLRFANDPRLELKGVAKTACHRGIIDYKNYRFLNDKGEVFCEVERNQDEWDAIADYFLSGQGKSYYEYVKNAID